ncbi:MAG: M28 family peptidase [Nitritalea sp.]
MKKKYLYGLGLCLALHLPQVQAQNISGFSADKQKQQETLEKRFLDLVDESGFRKHLEVLTKEPHPAGSEANKRVEAYMAETMQAAGWEVKRYPYDVFLSKEPGTSLIEIIRPHREPLSQQENEWEADPFLAHPDLGKGWNAFSGSGDVRGEVVYVNYGVKADFELLKKMGVDLKGKILIARYGGNFRGFKAKFAEEAGAAGLIIYTDPKDSGFTRGLTYPKGIFYDASAIQRGSLLTVPWTGDALTPFEPALPLDGKKKIARMDPETEGLLHSIPVLPIGYGAAEKILSQMQGQAVPPAWQGGLPFTYRIEGGSALEVRVKVDQKRDFVRATNVVGTLKGSQYPDEWIILGCHYDAWSFGSTDPNSGTALLLNLSETLQKLAREGFQPERSILIAHWDAEEHGVIGSTEWVEQLHDELQAKAVAYINLDAAVSGRNFGAASSPTLKQGIIEAAKMVTFPDSAKSVFEVWAGQKEEPTIGNLGGGSDHIAFYMHAGIPSLSGGASGPTLYHTNYDNMHFYETFADPSFRMGAAVERLVGILTLRLANAAVIPYQVSRYAQDLEGHFQAANRQVRNFEKDFEGFTKVNTALEALTAKGQAWDSALEKALAAGSLKSEQLKTINKQLLGLEKSFIDKKGMYFGDWYRSLYASNDPFSGYASWILPGIQYEVELQSSERLAEWDARYAAALEDLTRKIDALLQLL